MYDKDLDVTALGELLVDFIEAGSSDQGNPLYEANPGGAPCNVLSMLTKLGRKTAFIGKVGDDAFGRQLRNAICEIGIDDTGLCTDEKIHTTLAVVSKTATGDRDFAFYRSPGADMMLREDEVNPDLIRRAKIFHFGTLSLTDEPVRSATRRAVAEAEACGCVRSFDPNLRMPLWSSSEEAKEQIAWGLDHCDILKISDNEVVWFTGEEDYDKGIAALSQGRNIRLICLSMGKDGSRAYIDGKRVEVPAILQSGTIETTGAGDTFGACVLDGVLQYGLDNLNEQTMREILLFANASASIITTRKGALRVMPERSETLRLLEEKGLQYK
ncbi:MAG: carbohydrate kinase [Solobacterium sp.]|nr:carbohydrate kinase [Solobacterium sp.]